MSTPEPGRPPYTTPNFDLPVPGGEEDADGVTAFRELADRLDVVLKAIEDQVGGGAGGAGDLELIEDQILPLRVDTIEFTAIPQTFKHLRLYVIGTASATGLQAADVYMRFNGITTAFYDWQQLRLVDDEVDAARAEGAVWAPIGMLLGSAGENGLVGNVICDLPDYARQGNRAVVYQSQSACLAGSGRSFHRRIGSGQLRWDGGIINSITLLIDGGQFNDNCRATLYGLR